MIQHPKKPWGGKPQRLSDDDIRLIHALARERDELRAEHKRAKDRVADLWEKIQSLSNAEIAQKFDVTESVVSHALVSVRGNKCA